MIRDQDLITLRRYLHTIPELALDLPETKAALLGALQGLPIEIRHFDTSSALAVTIKGEQPGPTVLLRSDMDALPIIERSGVPFSSTNGLMHACGHDLHMAGLLGAVHELAARRTEFAGDVLCVFQPGEEGAGGAQLLIDEGVLETTGSVPVASYGVHVLSYYESGTFHCRAGAVMAASINFELEVHGRGGHAARPHQALDPVSVSAMVVQGIQTFVAQRSSPAEPLVVTVGSLIAGTAANVIPDSALLKVSLRATTLSQAHSVYEQIVGIGTGIAEAYGLTVRARILASLPPTISDPESVALARAVVADCFGPQAYGEMALPEMIAEDFSLFLNRTGGAFVLVGAALGAPPFEQLPTNHSPGARFDDAVVPGIARMLTELAVGTLTNGSPKRVRTSEAGAQLGL